MILGPSAPSPKTLEDLLGADLVSRLNALDVHSKRVFAGTMPGERRSKRRGQSVEFDDFRQYVPGDDLRHIDWNVFARLDKFFIKLFREEQDLSVHVVLDTSGSMLAASPAGGAPGMSKLDYARRLAMCIAYVAVAQNNRVQVSSFGSGPLRQSSPGRGRAHAAHLAAFLLEQDPAGADPEPFGLAMRRIAQTRAGKGIVVVLSDFLFPPEGADPGYAAGLGMLASGEFDVCAVRVLTPGEVDPASEGDRFRGDLKLTDTESGASAEISVSRALIASYRRRLAEFESGFETFCRARGISTGLFTTDTPIERVLLRDLRRLGVLR